MKTISNLIIISLFLTSGFCFSQNNLVSNPSFEELDGKPKKTGELNKAITWVSPTLGTSDLYCKSAKAAEIGVPLNVQGEQAARTGNNYAGAIFYSKKTNNIREYIQIELSSELEEGKVYCVEFYVSISDLSMHAIDKVGAHFSTDKIAADNLEPLIMTPQIINKTGRMLANQSEWEIICGEYTALGGEKYMTIGNFYPNEKTPIQKVKKPSSIKGTQNDYGYYYIDDVSVISSDAAGASCGCEAKLNPGKTMPKMNYKYSNVKGDEEKTMVAGDVIKSKIIFFDAGKTVISPNSKSDLDLILKLLKENPKLKVEIIGYANNSEVLLDSAIAENRSKKIMEFLVGGGIKQERLTVKATPGIAEYNEALKAKNCKVNFAVLPE